MKKVLTINEAKDKFINTWAILATQWGVSKTMGLVHGLLLTSSKPLTTDDIMELLVISRGNAHATLRELMDWGLVIKVLRPGKRKDLFAAEKDVLTFTSRIIEERRRRELTPLINLVKELQLIEPGKSQEGKEFKDLINQIGEVANQAEVGLDLLMKIKDSKVLQKLISSFAKM